MTSSISLQGETAPAATAIAASIPEAIVESEAIASNDAPNGFVALGLASELLQAVQDLGYTQPTVVQQKAIPLAMGEGGEDGRFIDLMVSSQTGSGKTAAFLLPVLHTLVAQQAEQQARERAEFERQAAEAAARGEASPKRPRRKNPTDSRNFKAAVPGALILCPTRELAQQVAHDAIDLVKHCKGLRIANVVGGMPYQMQIAKLQNANLVVATPGRLLDLQRSLQIKLDQVQFLVVDEADRMLDLGFSDDLAEINDLTAQRKQTMMFSATFAPRIQQLAMRVMHDGGSSVKKLQIDSPQEKHANIRQTLFWADNAQHKRKLLDHWLRDSAIDQAIVFASTQVECDGLAQDLQQEGFSAVALHGALSQGLRNRRLMALRNGQVQILVATDVAARGIDVPTITHVFNYGLPMKAEDYTHRIGRTGRAGRQGLAVTFAEFRDRRKIFDIEGYTRQAFKPEVIPGLEPVQRVASAGPRGGREGFGRDRRFGGRSEGRGDGRFGGDRGGDRNGDRFDRGPRSASRDGYGPARGFGDRGGLGERSGERNERFGDRFGDRSDDRFHDRAERGPRPERREGADFHGRKPHPGDGGRGGFGDRPRSGGFDRAPYQGGGARGDEQRRPMGHKPAGKPFVPHEGRSRSGTRTPR